MFFCFSMLTLRWLADLSTDVCLHENTWKWQHLCYGICCHVNTHCNGFSELWHEHYSCSLLVYTVNGVRSIYSIPWHVNGIHFNIYITDFRIFRLAWLPGKFFHAFFALYFNIALKSNSTSSIKVKLCCLTLQPCSVIVMIVYFLKIPRTKRHLYIW